MSRRRKTSRKSRKDPGPDAARARDALVERWRIDALRIARRIASSSGAAVPAGELESAAMWGLLDAIGRFDPDKGARFGTYLYHKVRGAVLDHVRYAMHRADRTRVRFHSLEELDKSLSGGGRGGGDLEDLSPHGTAVRSGRLACIGLSPATDSAANRLMESGAEGPHRDRAEVIALAMRALQHRPKLRKIVGMYFFEGRTLQQIGIKMRFSTQRAFQQIHTALHMMRRDLDALGIDGEDVT